MLKLEEADEGVQHPFGSESMSEFPGFLNVRISIGCNQEILEMRGDCKESAGEREGGRMAGIQQASNIISGEGDWTWAFLCEHEKSETHHANIVYHATTQPNPQPQPQPPSQDNNLMHSLTDNALKNLLLSLANPHGPPPPPPDDDFAGNSQCSPSLLNFDWNLYEMQEDTTVTLSHEQQAIQEIMQSLYAQYDVDSLASETSDKECSVKEEEIPELVYHVDDGPDNAMTGP
ncbi:hypothetical protein CPB84DRAFT_1858411 [Gymnopilus junonius]|uniref:Uncharacterized protein n=1 Tax=Gymnopilus junonius TaxID=109634 RepID=A0A9P5TED3_GYMJU|nr:hypothetical protein CPB84DRAFT_1858411 [Gymnopilus junonius]